MTKMRMNEFHWAKDEYKDKYPQARHSYNDNKFKDMTYWKNMKPSSLDILITDVNVNKK